MLTFKDFFAKKKINVVQFQAAEPALFAEFHQHYLLMGEKSFDHTKKYHFNNLRRTYPLPVIAKPHPVQAEDISQMAVQGIAVAAAQNLNEAIERPKFKEDHLVELSEPDVPEKDISLAEAENIILETPSETEVLKPTFKPRFNPKNIPKPKEEATPEAETENTEAAAKPAFKPRFNPKSISKTEADTKPEAEDQQSEAEPAKPAFKPRFNMQNFKKDVVKTASATDEPLQELVSKAQDAPKTMQPSATEPAELVVKPAFKPRFNPKNIPKQVAEPASEAVTQNLEINNETAEPKPDLQQAENQEIKTVSPDKISNPDVNPDSFETEKLPKKTVYKPRFQMKYIPKPPTNAD